MVLTLSFCQDRRTFIATGNRKLEYVRQQRHVVHHVLLTCLDRGVAAYLKGRVNVRLGALAVAECCHGIIGHGVHFLEAQEKFNIWVRTFFRLKVSLGTLLSIIWRRNRFKQFTDCQRAGFEPKPRMGVNFYNSFGYEFVNLHNSKISMICRIPSYLISTFFFCLFTISSYNVSCYFFLGSFIFHNCGILYRPHTSIRCLLCLFVFSLRFLLA